jgi:hypothetical protein
MILDRALLRRVDSVAVSDSVMLAVERNVRIARSLIRVNYCDARGLARKDHSSSSQHFLPRSARVHGRSQLLSQHISGDKTPDHGCK